MKMRRAIATITQMIQRNGSGMAGGGPANLDTSQTTKITVTATITRVINQERSGEWPASNKGARATKDKLPGGFISRSWQSDLYGRCDWFGKPKVLLPGETGCYVCALVDKRDVIGVKFDEDCFSAELEGDHAGCAGTGERVDDRVVRA